MEGKGRRPPPASQSFPFHFDGRYRQWSRYQLFVADQIINKNAGQDAESRRAGGRGNGVVGLPSECRQAPQSRFFSRRPVEAPDIMDPATRAWHKASPKQGVCSPTGFGRRRK